MLHPALQLPGMALWGLLLTSRAWAQATPWEPYILSPSSRTVRPVNISVQGGNYEVSSDAEGHVLSLDTGAQASLDYGVEVGGLVTLSIETLVDRSEGPQLSLAFAESPAHVGPVSDDATGSIASQDWDRELNITVDAGDVVTYTMPQERFRGGFRFMTIVARAPVTISNITCEIGFSPSQADLQDYSGYFYAPGHDLLSRIWYAAAYTAQTNIGPVDTGRHLPQVQPGWAYNSSTGVAGPVLMDGAKRDRAVWPGDHGISGQTAFLAFGDVGLEAFNNSLETMFYYQNESGRFPYAGPSTRSFNSGKESDTYHAWNLIAIYHFAIFAGDQEWLERHWGNITSAVGYILNGVDSNVGLHNQVGANDWGRQGTGGFNSALNALDYSALVSIASLAKALNKSDEAEAWSSAAEGIKEAFNGHLWDPDASLYNDNTTTSLHPQDGNAMALLFNLTQDASQAKALSKALTTNWNSFGPVTPELPDTISPFISGVEVLGHFAAGEPDRALELTGRLWGYLLDSPAMTGSTLAEGLAANGSLYYRGASGYNYDAAYTSMSHSWSTGPLVALTTKLAGLELSGWFRWSFAPRPGGGVQRVQSGFGSPLGQFSVSWTLVDGDFSANVSVPETTVGEVMLPWECETLRFDGRDWTGPFVDKVGSFVLEANGCDVDSGQ
ncbi:putative bacterial alpha-l-rhamnosidase domain protein [Diaporthe ampelina]|uniref:Putative bacterial alpha-l-rhamnosidase domain protein n=1 Tax=Diaporthe ampelina TaxID=1214573 RepID=A0A0G2F5E7_9PEZI|nr:putative bacterial alpha-l-rhamnosidase domain protein [Diaporthe ampelina]